MNAAVAGRACTKQCGRLDQCQGRSALVLVETAAMRRVQAPSRGGLDLSINHLDSPTGGLSSAGMRDVRLLPRRARRRPLWLRSLARSRPVSEHWGADRGLPIDRHYIE